MPISAWLVRASSSGNANSSSGAPRSVSHTPSIAAILAGWCSKVLSPCRSPSTACAGASTTPSHTPARSAAATAGVRCPRSHCQAEMPATRNATVRPDAISMCVRR